MHAALRADIELLGDFLGETLSRQEGQKLLDLVEEVRSLSMNNDFRYGQLRDWGCYLGFCWTLTSAGRSWRISNRSGTTVFMPRRCRSPARATPR